MELLLPVPQILLGYGRKSVVQTDAAMVSIEQQRHACESYRDIHFPDAEIVWFEDVGISGRTEEARPGWQDLLSRINQPGVVGVIAWSFDRMYRNVRQFLAFLDRLDKSGRQLISVREGLDTTTVFGRAVVTILMTVAQLESDVAGERMRRGIEYRRAVQGKHWGPAPFACERDDDGRLVPTDRCYWYNALTGEARLFDDDPGPGWERRRYYDGLVAIYQMYAIGSYGKQDVADVVNSAGWRYYKSTQPEPRLFTINDIARIVLSWAIYRGGVGLGRARDYGTRYIDGSHPPILPPELCSQVGEVRMARANRHGRKVGHTHERIYILSGVLYCGECGKRMRGGWEKHRFYRHHGVREGCSQNRIDAAPLEAAVVAGLVALAERDFSALLDTERERLARETLANDEATAGIVASLEREKQKLTRLEDLYLSGDIDRGRYLAQKAGIDQAIVELENRLYASSDRIDYRDAIDKLKAAVSLLDEASTVRQRAVIGSIYERIEIMGGEVVRVVPRAWARGIVGE